MAQRPEHAPGEAAPIAGTYEQLNVFGQSTGVRISVPHGHPLPAAPVGHNWVLTDKAKTEGRKTPMTDPAGHETAPSLPEEILAHKS
jgi:azurin